MIHYLLDTNIVSEAIRPHPEERVMKRLHLHRGQVALPSIVWHELLYGLGRMPEGRRRSFVEKYLRTVVAITMPVLPYDARAAQWHSAERARLESLGRPRPFVDGMIAAVAATRRLVLVTRNTPDFESYRDLRVQNWFAG